MTKNTRHGNSDGTAALGICESLLVALTDLKVISEQDARDLLSDVATAHEEAATLSLTPERIAQSRWLLDVSSPARTGCGPSQGALPTERLSSDYPPPCRGWRLRSLPREGCLEYKLCKRSYHSRGIELLRKSIDNASTQARLCARWVRALL